MTTDQRAWWDPLVNPRWRAWWWIATAATTAAAVVLGGGWWWSWLIGFVAFRLWRLAAVDTITEPLHGRLNAATSPLMQWVAALVFCPWCLGFWICLALTAATSATITGFGMLESALVTFASSTVCGLVASVDNRLQE